MVVTLSRVKVTKNITFKGIGEFRSLGLSDIGVCETDSGTYHPRVLVTSGFH